MVTIILLTLAVVAVQVVFSGIMLLAHLGTLGLSIIPGVLLIMVSLLAAWLVRD